MPPHFRPRLVFVAVSACCALFGATLLAGCKERVDRRAVEKLVRETLEDHAIAVKSVTCPADLVSKAGQQFQCTGELADGSKFVGNVTETKDGYKSSIVGRLADLKALGDQLEAGETDFDVECPAKTVLLRKGDTFKCAVIAGRIRAESTFTVKDDEGHVAMDKTAIVGLGAPKPVEKGPYDGDLVVVEDRLDPKGCAEVPPLAKEPFRWLRGETRNGMVGKGLSLSSCGTADACDWLPLAFLTTETDGGWSEDANESSTAQGACASIGRQTWSLRTTSDGAVRIEHKQYELPTSLLPKACPEEVPAALASKLRCVEARVIVAKLPKKP